ncbi:MAG TPA: hypothetical protein VF145_00085 [Chitinophagaceae bacterium]
MENEIQQTIVIRAYSLYQLAELYSVTPRVMKRWLSTLQPALGPRIGRYYYLEQVLLIIEKLGTPGVYTGED